MSDLANRLDSWAAFIAIGYECPAAGPVMTEAAARIRLLEQQLKTAREALEPFAKEAFRYEPPEGDDDMNAWDSQFTIGQFRSAAAAIRSLGEKE